LNAVSSACPEADVSVQKELLCEVSALLSEAQVALSALKDLQAKGAEITDGKEAAYFYKDEVVPAMAALRTPIDQLEMIVDKEYWPVPSYGDMMFEV
jgi:glutamine synthetase